MSDIYVNVELSGPDHFWALDDVSYWLDGVTETTSNVSYLVFENGCGTGSSRNCSEACMNSTTLFGQTDSGYTLQNCAFVSTILDSEKASEPFDNKTYRVADSDKEYFEGFFGTPAGSINSSALSRQIQSCFDDYCQNFGFNWNTPYSANVENLNFTGIAAQLNSLCSTTQGQDPGTYQVSSDAGGPGVIISYGVQFIITLIGFFMFKIMTRWIRNIILYVFPGPLYWWRCEGGMQRGREIARSWQNTFHSPKQVASLTAGLVDFQKAQCCFTISVQVASEIALFARKHNRLGAKSLFQLTSTTRLIGTLAYLSTMTVSLVQISLYQLGQKSFFVWLLAFLSIVLCGATAGYEWDDWVTPIVDQPAPLASCGGQNPWRLCDTSSAGSVQLTGDISYSLGPFDYRTLVPFWIAIAMVFILQFLDLDRDQVPHHGAVAEAKDVSKQEPIVKQYVMAARRRSREIYWAIPSSRRKWLHRVRILLFALTEAYTIGLLIALVTEMFPLQEGIGSVSFSGDNWQFGQVVSIELVYYCCLR